MRSIADPRRSLPAVDRLVRALEAVTGGPPLWALREAAREVLEAERDAARPRGRWSRPTAGSEPDLVARARARARGARARRIPSPSSTRPGSCCTRTWAARRSRRARRARWSWRPRSYGDLELDLATGERGSRGAAVEQQAAAALGRGGRARRQQQRRRGAARARGPRAGAGRDRLARRAGRDRRLVPGARDHGVRGRAPGRSRHDQPHPPARLRVRDRRGHRAAAQGASQQFRPPGLRGRGRPRRARRARRAARPSARGGSRQRHADRPLATRASRGGLCAGPARARRGRRLLLRRQAARRAAGRHHPHARRRAGRPVAASSPRPRAAHGQAVARGARLDARRPTSRGAPSARSPCCDSCSRRPTSCAGAPRRSPIGSARARGSAPRRTSRPIAATRAAGRCPSTRSTAGWCASRRRSAPSGSPRGCARAVRPCSRAFATTALILDVRTLLDGDEDGLVRALLEALR